MPRKKIVLSRDESARLLADPPALIARVGGLEATRIVTAEAAARRMARESLEWIRTVTVLGELRNDLTALRSRLLLVGAAVADKIEDGADQLTIQRAIEREVNKAFAEISAEGIVDAAVQDRATRRAEGARRRQRRAEAA